MKKACKDAVIVVRNCYEIHIQTKTESGGQRAPRSALQEARRFGQAPEGGRT